MARKKQKSLISILATAPWWLSVVFAGVTYIGLRYTLPPIFARNLILGPATKAFAGSAGYFSLLFLAVAFIAFLNQLKRRKLLHAQKDIESVRNMPWQDFEKLTSEVFRQSGFSIEERGGSGPDGGIDLIIRKDGKRHIVQCKRWKTVQVGVSPVRELYGVMAAEHADGCVFVTSGAYTKDALEFAQGKPVWLIDGEELLGRIKTIQQTNNVVSLARHVKGSDRFNNAPSVQTMTASPVVSVPPDCPKCGNRMVRRSSRKSGIESEFWGCSTFPKCRGIRSID